LLLSVSHYEPATTEIYTLSLHDALPIFVESYGPPEVARVVELPTPEPRAGEVLVRVHAAAVTSGDARMRSGSFPPGFALPGKLRSEEHTSELQSRENLVCRLLLEKKKRT